MRLIAKDIKFNQSRKFHDRIAKVLVTLLTQPNESFVWRAEQFANNFVLKMFKKKLLRTLKSTR
jgi:hypothetical protein